MADTKKIPKLAKSKKEWKKYLRKDKKKSPKNLIYNMDLWNT